MAALPNLVTVEQFRNLPDDGQKYELRHGEVVPVGYPKAKHDNAQERLVDLLKARLPRSWRVGMEFPYRALPEFDFRCADVAVVSRSRAIDPEDSIRGAPELVIEVESPSNTRRELAELASLCLSNGSLEFWIIDLDKLSVTVMHRDGTACVYATGQSIPLTAFGADSLPVDAIFAQE